MKSILSITAIIFILAFLNSAYAASDGPGKILLIQVYSASQSGGVNNSVKIRVDFPACGHKANENIAVANSHVNNPEAIAGVRNIVTIGLAAYLAGKNVRIGCHGDQLRFIYLSG